MGKDDWVGMIDQWRIDEETTNELSHNLAMEIILKFVSPSGDVSSDGIANQKSIYSGRSAARLAHLTGGQGVAGSNPAAPTRNPL